MSGRATRKQNLAVIYDAYDDEYALDLGGYRSGRGAQEAKSRATEAR